MEFHPHRFHPTRFAEDPYDLLLPVEESDRPKIIGKCKCDDPFHKNHLGKECGVEVERYCMPNKQGYLCFDCKVEKQTEREKHYFRKNGKSLRKHV